MSLDAPTLTFAGGAVAFSSGVFMLCYWALDRSALSAFWWALSNCGWGFCIMLFPYRAFVPSYVGMITTQILTLCAAQVFVAARIFNRGSINFYPLTGAVLFWTIAQFLCDAYGWQNLVMMIGAVVCGGFFAAAALEFWLGRAERLHGRTGLIVILGSFAASLLLTTLGAASTKTFPPPPENDWFSVIHFTGLAYPISVTMFLTAMLQQRASAAYEAAALSDPLTGLANRRAFLDRARSVMDRTGRDATSVALLAFDLDRFKNINDTFGHATGDAALVTFARVLSSTLRATSLVARIGGEEFVAVIPGASGNDAVAVANRVRDAFRSEAELINEQRVGATVSVGVATRGGQGSTLADLLATADAALYRAKSAGRNCVVLADPEPGDPSSGRPTLLTGAHLGNHDGSPGNLAPTA